VLVGLVLKRYIPWITFDQTREKIILGKGRVNKQMVKELTRLRDQAKLLMGEIPVLVGETGIAYDMHGKKAYKTGDFSPQIKAMDRLIKALSTSFLNFTLWNYTVDNSNEFGDGWNGEDLSIFSRDQQDNAEDINSGGRALEALVRPWARKIAGQPVKIKFNIRSRDFTFSFRHDPDVKGPTEIFVPAYQYPQGYTIHVSDGSFQVDTPTQLVLWHHDPGKSKHTIRISPRKCHLVRK